MSEANNLEMTTEKMMGETIGRGAGEQGNRGDLISLAPLPPCSLAD